jgi:hypothetical protein
MATSHSNQLIRRPGQIAEDRAQKSREFLDSVFKEIGRIAESNFDPSRPREILKASIDDPGGLAKSLGSDIDAELIRCGWELRNLSTISDRNELFSIIQFSAAESDIPTDGGTP